MKYLSILLLVFSQLVFADCPQFSPLGKTIAVPNSVELCNSFYAVEFDTLHNRPIVSVEKFRVSTKHVARTNDFHTDTRIDNNVAAVDIDYIGAHTKDGKDKYDRGHLTPAADATTIEEMHDTFLFSNMTPQCGTVNEKSWKDMEEAVRIMAPDYIVTGAVYSSNPYTVGKHKIPVPDSFYKVVYKNKTIKVYVANNVPNALVNEIKIEALEKITKLKFPRY